jgi:hypothetical protein
VTVCVFGPLAGSRSGRHGDGVGVPAQGCSRTDTYRSRRVIVPFRHRSLHSVFGARSRVEKSVTDADSAVALIERRQGMRPLWWLT